MTLIWLVVAQAAGHDQADNPGAVLGSALKNCRSIRELFGKRYKHSRASTSSFSMFGTYQYTSAGKVTGKFQFLYICICFPQESDRICMIRS